MVDWAVSQFLQHNCCSMDSLITVLCRNVSIHLLCHVLFWGTESVLSPEGSHRALCPRCTKGRLFFTTSSHGSQGPDYCTLQPLLVHQGFFVLV